MTTSEVKHMAYYQTAFAEIFYLEREIIRIYAQMMNEQPPALSTLLLGEPQAATKDFLLALVQDFETRLARMKQETGFDDTRQALDPTPLS